MFLYKFHFLCFDHRVPPQPSDINTHRAIIHTERFPGFNGLTLSVTWGGNVKIKLKLVA